MKILRLVEGATSRVSRCCLNRELSKPVTSVVTGNDAEILFFTCEATKKIEHRVFFLLG